MIRVQQEDFDPGAELERLRSSLQGRVGAMVSFTGLVRDLNAGDAITGMTLEHYPGMTEKGAGHHRRRGNQSLETDRRRHHPSRRPAGAE